MYIKLKELENINKKFGLMITVKRKACEITAIELAEQIGVSTQTIYKYEQGKVDIPLSKLEKICKTLNFKFEIR